MADITKCKGHRCEIKEGCFRFLAESTSYQSYSDFYKDRKPCNNYWPVKSQSELKRYKALTKG